MMSDRDQIVNNLKSLHMPTVRRSYEEMGDQARAEALGLRIYWPLVIREAVKPIYCVPLAMN